LAEWYAQIFASSSDNLKNIIYALVEVGWGICSHRSPLPPTKRLMTHYAEQKTAGGGGGELCD
jgi:hypothetical protein